MITKVQKWGNSQGVRLSKELLANAEIGVGDPVQVSARDGVLVVRPARRVRGGLDLRALVRGIRQDYNVEELDWGDAVGKEVW